ncbi:hypothetical protein RGQ13_02475 [Thalassotalea psychrophila]|uniref:Outer membrane protein beta-barrel domain-containing protein n=1 Tax=Thalassotalea psychrophila TaxID=3065647 RepID=A0ABY9TYI0_9GAMM|nr:hypothetical protein RGQ13_02475 [Colwelliaceae bacterium SQ149]
MLVNNVYNNTNIALKIINFKVKAVVIAILLLCTVSLATSAADNDVFIGIGLSDQQQDNADSVNLSFIAGYNFYNRNFQESRFQTLTLGIEAQYSDSISGSDDTKNYSMFFAQRLYTSKHYYLKFKQGLTDFPKASTNNSDEESSHIGVGVGLGYKFNTGAIEIEYVYPNKTIHASIVEISYKYHF